MFEIMYTLEEKKKARNATIYVCLPKCNKHNKKKRKMCKTMA